MERVHTPLARGTQGVELWLARQSGQPLTDLHTPGFFIAMGIGVFTRITEKGRLPGPPNPFP